LHEEEDGLDGREASRVFGSESGEFERGLSLVRSLLLVLVLLLLRFCENALVLANSFFTFDETFVIF
jgi:hypothetical protein